CLSVKRPLPLHRWDLVSARYGGSLCLKAPYRGEVLPACLALSATRSDQPANAPGARTFRLDVSDGFCASRCSAFASAARSASRNADACADRRECPLFHTSF